MFFNPQPQQQSPGMFGGMQGNPQLMQLLQQNPQLLQMLQQRMQGGGGMPGMQPPGMMQGGQPTTPAPPPTQGPQGITPQTPVNVPHFMPPPPVQGMDAQSGGQGDMNPLASILGNGGGAMNGGMDLGKILQMFKQKQQDQAALGGNLSNGMPTPTGPSAPGGMPVTSIGGGGASALAPQGGMQNFGVPSWVTPELLQQLMSGKFRAGGQ